MTLSSKAIDQLTPPGLDRRRSSPPLYRQVARIICHLRDQYHSEHPELSMPTRWIVESLVFNAEPQISAYPQADWLATVTTTLEALEDLTREELKQPGRLTRTDGVTPLFPNKDLFDEWDAQQFTRALLTYLRTELS